MIEVDMQGAGQVLRQTRRVDDGEDLADLTGRDVYANVVIGTIEKGLMQLNVPGDVKYLRAGEAIGDVDRDSIVRKMINRVIREHFDREKALKPQGIKVLSLFFIDKVEHYRIHGDDGGQTLGKYGVMFEQEYRALAAHPDYKASLFADAPPAPERAHDGYFSKDRKGKVTEPELNASGELKNAATREDAERGWKLIMRDKEKLLDEAEPLRFIFSHSALREGWDNPNVFQLCALREMGGDRERRQTIGRGLRLCVDSRGERRRDEGLNVLTVVADESYATFADGLQKQIENDLGIRFGAIDGESFAHLTYETPEGDFAPLGVAASKALFAHLTANGLVDARGKIQDRLRASLKAGTLVLPEQFDAVAVAARALLTRLAGRLEVGNADERRKIAVNKRVFLGEDFHALWDRIKAKTTYRLAFDNEALIKDATRRLADMPPVARAQARFRKAQIAITQAGVEGVGETTSGFMGLTPEAFDLPDVLGELQNRTQLTRRSLAGILVDCGRLDDLRHNPAAFLDEAATRIGRAKIAALVDGVRYARIGADSFYAQELFESEELMGYLGKLVDVKKAPTDCISFDSGVERSFAEALDANEAVKVFAKLPSWFKVPTPLGGYNPDWAVLVTDEAGERLYFVVETKGSELIEDLTGKEAGKIRCGDAHFAAIRDERGQPIFKQEKDAANFLSAIGS